jgi:hypothetical protein
MPPQPAALCGPRGCAVWQAASAPLAGVGAGVCSKAVPLGHSAVSLAQVVRHALGVSDQCRLDYKQSCS